MKRELFNGDRGLFWIEDEEHGSVPLVDADIGLNQQTKLRTSPGRVLPNEQDQQQNGKHTNYRRHVGGGQ